jgi:hypothetical protein
LNSKNKEQNKEMNRYDEKLKNKQEIVQDGSSIQNDGIRYDYDDSSDLK